MKRLITVGILAALIVTACFTGHTVINRAGRDVGGLLTESIEAAQDGDAKKAYELSLKAEKAFIEAEGRISFFIYHDLVEGMGLQISKLPDLACDETLSEFSAEANGALVMLTHIVNDEKPTLLNVF